MVNKLMMASVYLSNEWTQFNTNVWYWKSLLKTNLLKHLTAEMNLIKTIWITTYNIGSYPSL